MRRRRCRSAGKQMNQSSERSQLPTLAPGCRIAWALDSGIAAADLPAASLEPAWRS